ncbi:hypothetical protein P4133_10875 [Pseudomonas aeruginosa]|nr:hypothetical protein [Pseudomonas aeruginosa]
MAWPLLPPALRSSRSRPCSSGRYASDERLRHSTHHQGIALPPLATLGQQLVRLGQAMQNPNTKLGELTELVQACGVDLRICDTNKESRA